MYVFAISDESLEVLFSGFNPVTHLYFGDCLPRGLLARIGEYTEMWNTIYQLFYECNVLYRAVALCVACLTLDSQIASLNGTTY
jgi:hypothetical protein